MSAPAKTGSKTSSLKSRRGSDTSVASQNILVPVDSKRKLSLPGRNTGIPEEILASLNTSVYRRDIQGRTTHQRICQGSEIKRPDPVWHHSFGREKYKYFLEQPQSLGAAGRDISFLCDAVMKENKLSLLPPMVDGSQVEFEGLIFDSAELPITDEYYVVKNKGIRCLELYEDAFTVQVKDGDEKLRLFPSLQPSGRREVVQLMNVMDEMLEKAGVRELKEDAKSLSPLEAILELVKDEQAIYNLVFHEVIRQVSVNCAERGQLLSKLRKRYQALLNKIPQSLKALHSEVVIQRALDRRLTEEIHRIKASLQDINIELYKIKDYDAALIQRAELDYRQLAEELKHAQNCSDVVQGYHRLYEMHRSQLVSELQEMTQDRDRWRHFTFAFALKMINVKKLNVVGQLHTIEKSWLKSSKQWLAFLSTRDTDDLNAVTEHCNTLKEKLVSSLAELKSIRREQCAKVREALNGFTKWFKYLSVENKAAHSNCDKKMLEIHEDFKKWSESLNFLRENFQREKQNMFKARLSELTYLQEQWLYISRCLFEKHPLPDAQTSEVEVFLRELDKDLGEILAFVFSQTGGRCGIVSMIVSLLMSMDPWMSKLSSSIEDNRKLSFFEWRELEEAIYNWQLLTHEALIEFSSPEEGGTDTKSPAVYAKADIFYDLIKEFPTRLSDFIQDENQKLSNEVHNINVAQGRWMLEYLIFMIPDCNDVEDQRPKPECIKKIAPETLNEEASKLIEKLQYYSAYIVRSSSRALEEFISLDPHNAEYRKKLTECKEVLEYFCDWENICNILLVDVNSGLDEQTPESSQRTRRDSMDFMAKFMRDLEDASQIGRSEAFFEQETSLLPSEEEELTDSENPVMNVIAYDGTIEQKIIGQSTFPLPGTEERVLTPMNEESQRSLHDLNTVIDLQKQLLESEERVVNAEQRSIQSEQALQSALDRIKDLERQMEIEAKQESKGVEEKKEPTTSAAPEETTSTPKKTKLKPSTTSRKSKKK